MNRQIHLPISGSSSPMRHRAFRFGLTQTFEPAVHCATWSEPSLPFTALLKVQNGSHTCCYIAAAFASMIANGNHPNKERKCLQSIEVLLFQISTTGNDSAYQPGPPKQL